MRTMYASATDETVERLGWAHAMVATAPEPRIRSTRSPVMALLGTACAAVWIYDVGVALAGVGTSVMRF